MASFQGENGRTSPPVLTTAEQVDFEALYRVAEGAHGTYMGSALIVVDIQNDFTTGSLSVPKANGIFINKINRLMKSGKFDLIVGSQDWHPKGHCSFKVWPEHCVQGTWGAELDDRLDREYFLATVKKGRNRELDAYSAFGSQIDSIGMNLENLLHQYNIESVSVCGLAFDYCVKHTAIDAKRNGFATINVLYTYTRSVYPDNDVSVKNDLIKSLVNVVV